MDIIAEILSWIASAGKIITDTNNWSLTVESPYVLGVHGAQSPATVDQITTPGDTSLLIAFTYNGVQFTVLATPSGQDASVSIEGQVQPTARLVTAGVSPINIDFRPVTLPGSATVVRLNFEFNDV